MRAGDCWNDATAVAVGAPTGLSPQDDSIYANGQRCEFRSDPVHAVLVLVGASTLEVQTEPRDGHRYHRDHLTPGGGRPHLEAGKAPRRPEDDRLDLYDLRTASAFRLGESLDSRPAFDLETWATGSQRDMIARRSSAVGSGS